MAELSSLVVADEAEVWKDLGFDVNGGASWIGMVRHDLVGGEGRGVTKWRLTDVEFEGDTLEGLPTAVMEAIDPDVAAFHPNGTISIDHLVIRTPNLPRTVDAFQEAGLLYRRTRDAGRVHQAFFRAGEVILEIVGPPDPAGDGPAQFYGLAFNVVDLDDTAKYLGDRLHPAKEAVQPGRRIATLDKGAGSSVAIAFMSQP
jgi:hypothetical protein